MATLEQLAEGIKRAHAAGDANAVRVLGQSYLAMQAQMASPAPQPVSGEQMARELNLPVPGMMTPDPEKPIRYHSMIPGGDMLNEYATSFGENIPVVGPATSQAAHTVGSHLAAAITGESPEAMLAQGLELRARDAADNPAANTAGAITGAVGPVMAFGATPLGAQVLGNTGNLVQRVLAGGTSGAGLAFGDQYARTGDVDAALGAAKWGALAGTVAPAVERLVLPAVKALFGSGSASAPVNSVAASLERSGIDPATIPQRLEEIGPDAMLLDLDQILGRKAAAIASLPGEGQAALNNAITARNSGTNLRIQDDIAALLGEAPTPSYVQAEIRAGQDALQPSYTEVLKDAAPVETQWLAEWLDATADRVKGPAQTAAEKVRAMLNERGRSTLSTSAETLLSTRKAIDGLMDGETNRDVLGVLTTARQQVDRMLGEAVLGIKEVDAQFAELARQSEGLTQGGSVLDSGKTAIRPTELQDMVEQGVQPQGLFVGPSGETFRISQGARAEIDRLIGTTANDLNALKTALKGDGSWNRSRLATLYGEQKADALLAVLEREQTYQRSYQLITGNSETAARTQALEEVKPSQYDLNFQKLLLGLPQKVANVAARSRSENINAAIAELLIGNPSPELIDKLIASRRTTQGLVGSSIAPLLVNQ